MAAGAGAGAVTIVGGATYLSEYDTTVESTDIHSTNIEYGGGDGQYRYEGSGEDGEYGYEEEYYEEEYYEGDEYPEDYADATSAGYDTSFADQYQQPQVSSSASEGQVTKEGPGE